MVVLVRTLLSAPGLSRPPTRRLLSRWRLSPLSVRGSCWISALGEDGLTNLHVDGFREGFPRQLSNSFKKNSRFEWGVGLSRNGHGWQQVSQTRIQCLSTFPSSKEVTVNCPVNLEEDFTPGADAQAAVEQLQVDGPLALKLGIEALEDLEKTETVELSILLCSDAFIQDLNSKWLGKDSPTDVLSFPQEQELGLSPHLLLGDVIISLETAARQAEERGHTLVDELRILLVHGLLHVLGFDHELGPDASEEMEAKESEILSKLGWMGKGLINATQHSSSEDVEAVNGGSKTAVVRLDEPVRKPAAKPPFKILFCDMDGTILNDKSRVTEATGDALRAVMAKGVQVIIATGKTQYAAMAALKPVGLVGEGGIVASTLPGVFIQGLQVYGKGGTVIHKALLYPELIKKAFDYSMEHNIPTVGFSENRIVTLFRHPFTDAFHEVYLEPKVEVIPSIDDLIASCPIQKILFYDTPESIEFKVRPHWALQTQGKATLVQAMEDMLEILPPGQSKGNAVKILLDHFGVSPEEVMAIGDGENDIEMLKLAGWGVAMANGYKLTKAVANALTGSNTEDGAAQAMHRYILS